VGGMCVEVLAQGMLRRVGGAGGGGDGPRTRCSNDPLPQHQTPTGFITPNKATIMRTLSCFGLKHSAAVLGNILH